MFMNILLNSDKSRNEELLKHHNYYEVFDRFTLAWFPSHLSDFVSSIAAFDHSQKARLPLGSAFHFLLFFIYKLFLVHLTHYHSYR